MAPKGAASSVEVSEPKRRRRMMTIAQKVKVLDMAKNGMTFAAIARHFGANESTIRYIKKEEVSIRKTAAITFNESAKRVVTPRNRTIVLMEAALVVWIAECRTKDIALDTKTITRKARSLYEAFAANEINGRKEDPRPRQRFSASKGWFQKFKRRYGLKSVHLQGEAPPADKSAPGTFKDETVQRMLSRTFPFKDETKVEDKEVVVERAGWTLERIVQVFDLVERLKEQVQKWDDNAVRSEQFYKSIDEAMSPYKVLLHSKKKQIAQQLSITMFLQCPLKKDPVPASVEPMNEAEEKSSASK